MLILWSKLSVKRRLQLFLKEVREFESVFSKVEALVVSALSGGDAANMVTELYSGYKVIAPRKDAETPFQIYKAWLVLRNMPKLGVCVRSCDNDKNGKGNENLGKRQYRNGRVRKRLRDSKVVFILA